MSVSDKHRNSYRDGGTSGQSLHAKHFRRATLAGMFIRFSLFPVFQSERKGPRDSLDNEIAALQTAHTCQMRSQSAAALEHPEHLVRELLLRIKTMYPPNLVPSSGSQSALCSSRACHHAHPGH